MPALSKSLPLRVTTVCAVTAALGVTAPAADAHAADPPRTTRVSVSTGGTQADGASTSPQLSANGRYVAFLSNASNLVPGDTNSFYDVFLHDRNTGRTELVSRGHGGAAANDASRPPRMSANGRYVVFYSFATNLVPGDTNRAPDTFIYDRITKAVSIVPVGTSGSVDPDVSADGRFITIATIAKLVPEDVNPGGDVYVYDTMTRTFELVTRATSGDEPGSAQSKETSISDDGRFVGFASDGTDIVPGKRGHQVYLFDRTTKKTVLVSRNAAGDAGDEVSGQPALSRNGRWITFISAASNLVPGDTNTDYDVFLFDRRTNKLALVSATPAGTSGDARSLYPAISGDGRFVSFSSKATNLVPTRPEPEPGRPHVYRYDHQTKVLDVMSVPANGKGSGFSSAMSHNGAILAFDSAAAGFVANDTNDTYDIFVQQR